MAVPLDARVCYSGVFPWVLRCIEQFNSAGLTWSHEQQEGDTCPICHDSIPIRENGTFARITLPDCKHTFHELCALQWLSPILLPPTTREPTGSTSRLDPVVLSLEARADSVNRATPPPPSLSASRDHEIISEIESLERRLTDYREIISNNVPWFGGMRSITAGISRRLARLRTLNAGRDRDIDIEIDLLTTRLRLWRIGDRLESIVDSVSRLLRIIGPRSELRILDDDLEEGEIREGEPTTYDPNFGLASADDDDGRNNGPVGQELPPADIFDGSFPHIAAASSSSPTARSKQCPLCRQPAFDDESSPHADTVQLLRVRLRLANLAYACYRFSQSPVEKIDRANIEAFLERRHADNVAAGDQEVIPSLRNCKRIFKQARLQLRGEMYRSIRMYASHRTHSQINMLYLVAFYENFVLKDEHVQYFFDPSPGPDQTWEWVVAKDCVPYLFEEPRKFCQSLNLRERSEKPWYGDVEEEPKGRDPGALREWVRMDDDRDEETDETKRIRLAAAHLLNGEDDDQAMDYDMADFPV
ncbi:MAG: hypothetical protein Q9201_000113 [Fulgogasparrea decipioides]